MNQPDNDTAKAIMISNLFFILAFIGLILGGFSISVDRTSHTQKVLLEENVTVSFREDIVNLSPSTLTTLSSIDTSNAEGNNSQIAVDKARPNKRVAELNGKEAMLGVFLVMLKQR